MANRTAYDILVGWLIRDHAFPAVEAKLEAKRVMSCEDKNAYKRFKRFGSTVALTRRERMNIWLTYENALRHESIIEEMALAGAL